MEKFYQYLQEMGKAQLANHLRVKLKGKYDQHLYFSGDTRALYDEYSKSNR